MGFSDEALGLTDKLLALMMRKGDDKHPFTEVLFESVMTVREMLCCWDAKKLHHVGYEQLVARNYTIKAHINSLARKVLPPIESYLHKFSAAVGQGWQKRWFSVHNHHMTFHRMKGSPPHKALDLTSYVEVTPILSAADPEFMVNVQTKLYKLKASTDRERCMWIELLEHYQRRRQINAQLLSYTVTEKLKLFIEGICSQQTPREKQFLFSNLDRNAPHPRQGDRREAQDPFMVIVPQSFGKRKGRKLEFIFDGDKRQLLITKDDENQPYIHASPVNLLDFKIVTKKFLVTLSLFRDGRKSTKEYKFPSHSEFTRFNNVLEMFRQYNNGFMFHHADLLKRFKNISEVEILKLCGFIADDGRGPSTDEIDNLPPPSPSVPTSESSFTEDSDESVPPPPGEMRVMAVQSGRRNSDNPVTNAFGPGKNHDLDSYRSMPSPKRNKHPAQRNASPPPPMPSKSKKPAKIKRPPKISPGRKSSPPSGGRSPPPSGGRSSPPSGGRSSPPSGGRSSPPSGGRSPHSGGRSPHSGGKSPPSGGRGPPGGRSAPSGVRAPPSAGKSPASPGRGPPSLRVTPPTSPAGKRAPSPGRGSPRKPPTGKSTGKRQPPASSGRGPPPGNQRKKSPPPGNQRKKSPPPGNQRKKSPPPGSQKKTSPNKRPPIPRLPPGAKGRSAPPSPRRTGRC